MIKSSSFGRNLAAAACLAFASPAAAGVYDLVIEKRTVNITGRERPATLINGQLPGPVLRFKEGEDATIRVTNRLDEITSVHWHGLLLPSSQDGVPGVSDGFQGIPAGQTFTYRFPIVQAGTYWYHSHSAGQEQTGMYAPIVIEPAKREPFRYDREYIVMLSDWTDEDPEEIISNLKMDPGYYNYNKRTLLDVIRDSRRAGSAEERKSVWSNWFMWRQMRMDPTDIADVTGYTFLVNGKSPEQNFTALFKPGERVRLRFINGSAMTYFDVRIPGLKMTVVQADGNNVQPVPVDEFRISVAETYDVIVQPREDVAYSILAESMDRAGFARATLAPREGMVAAIPPHRPRPILNMADMGMSFGPTGLDRGTLHPEADRPGHVAPMDMDHGDMTGMDHAGMGHGTAASAAPADHAAMGHGSPAAAPASKADAPSGSTDYAVMGHGGTKPAQPMDHAAMGHGAPPDARSQDHSSMEHGTPAQPAQSTDHASMGHGSGAPVAGHDASMGSMPDPIVNDTGAPPGARVLSYRDLNALASPFDAREPDRVIEIRLTGNMERYFWSINGRKFSESEPIVLRYGERVRFKFINETMMNHAMHLHGMWMLPQVGNGARNPLKHVINVKPGTVLEADIPVDAEGGWAFHCHLLYHMETGMMRKVVVQRQTAAADGSDAHAKH